MMLVQDYLHGLAETAGNILFGLAALWAAYRMVRYTHSHRPR